MRKIFVPPPPLETPGGWQNLNCKIKTFGFLDIKVHKQSNYLAITTQSLLQTKLAEKKTNLLCSFSFRSVGHINAYRTENKM